MEAITGVASTCTEAMETNPRSRRAGWRDVQLGLATAASVQASIRHADSKVAALFAVQGGVAVTAAQHTSTLISTGLIAAVPCWLMVLTVLLGVSLAIGLINGTWQLVMALRPRLEGPRGANRFGFPNVARTRRRPTTTPIARQRDEAWDLVATLAAIALAKHAGVRRSLPWIVAAMVSTAGLLSTEMLALSLAR